MNGNSLPIALLFSSLAGLSTLVGSVITVFLFKPGPRFMSFTMGFSAGVMILVSFGELLQEGVASAGFAPAYIAFFGGMGMMFLLDILIPHIHMGESHDAKVGLAEPPCPEHLPDGACGGGRRGWGHRFRHGGGYRRMAQGKLLKTGLLVALGIGIHNLPEGITTFVGTMQDAKLGLLIAVAIALHNIPEGISVSAPVFAATGNRWKALGWSALSGLAEPAGALLAAAFLLPFLTPSIMGLVLGAVAGIMVFISLDELIPVACSYCQEHVSILGVISGMVVMAVSLGLLRI